MDVRIGLCTPFLNCGEIVILIWSLRRNDNCFEGVMGVIYN